MTWCIWTTLQLLHTWYLVALLLHLFTRIFLWVINHIVLLFLLDTWENKVKTSCLAHHHTCKWESHNVYLYFLISSFSMTIVFLIRGNTLLLWKEPQVTINNINNFNLLHMNNVPGMVLSASQHLYLVDTIIISNFQVREMKLTEI